MTRTNILLTTTGVAALGATVVAIASIWLLLSAPATVAEAVDSQELVPVFRAVVGVLYDALRALVRYL